MLYRGILVLTAMAAAAPAGAETFRLRAGRTLHGEVVAADEQGVAVKRWDNGGAVFLPWISLSAGEARRLRGAFLRDAAAVRPTVPGVRIITEQGAVVEGIVIEETSDRVVLKLGARRPQVPARSIRTRIDLDLDLEAVYTPEELVERKAAELDLATADGALALADYALSLRLPARARALYQEAATIDPTRKEQIDQLLADFDRRQREAEARKLRTDLPVLAAAGKFEQVREALAKLNDAYAETEAAQGIEDLVRTYEAEEEQYRKNRDEFLRAKIVPEWLHTMDALLRKKGGDRKETLEKARGWLDGELQTEIKGRLASKFGIPDADVDKYWSERQMTQSRSASYGSGSWIVEGGQSGEVGGGNRGSTLDRLLGGGGRQGGGNRGGNPQQQQQKPKGYKLDTPEEWWTYATSLTRAEWLEAAFAEKALKVLQRKTKPCPQCSGQGTIIRMTIQAGGGTREELPCKRCHGSKNEITVVYQ
jgi:hypothetical protein